MKTQSFPSRHWLPTLTFRVPLTAAAGPSGQVAAALSPLRGPGARWVPTECSSIHPLAAGLPILRGNEPQPLEHNAGWVFKRKSQNGLEISQMGFLEGGGASQLPRFVLAPPGAMAGIRSPPTSTAGGPSIHRLRPCSRGGRLPGLLPLTLAHGPVHLLRGARGVLSNIKAKSKRSSGQVSNHIPSLSECDPSFSSPPQEALRNQSSCSPPCPFHANLPRTRRTCFHHRAFAHAVSTNWNILPPGSRMEDSSDSFRHWPKWYTSERTFRCPNLK